RPGLRGPVKIETNHEISPCMTSENQPPRRLSGRPLFVTPWTRLGVAAAGVFVVVLIGILAARSGFSRRPRSEPGAPRAMTAVSPGSQNGAVLPQDPGAFQPLGPGDSPRTGSPPADLLPRLRDRLRQKPTDTRTRVVLAALLETSG